MKSEWNIYHLSEITHKITKGTTPSKKDGGFSSSGINYIKAESVGYDGSIDDSKFSFIDISVHEKLKRSQLEISDILFSMAGVHLGKSGIIEKKHLPANTNQALALIRPNQNIIYPKYLHYFLQQRSIITYVNNSTSQSAQPNINLADIGKLEIRFPELYIQKKIAHILSSLDDKIELNRKMNQTLEAMAQALFKSWFVDFDPVHLKAKCTSEEELEAGAKELGISKEVLELFPSEFVESEMGMIPLGWEVKPISEVSSVAIGKTPPRKEPQWFTTNTDDIKWVSIRDMGNNGMYTLETSEYLTKEAIERFNVKIIPSNTVLLSFKLTLGRVSITTEAMTSNEAIAHFVLDESSVLSTEFIYCYLKNFDYNMLGSTSSIATAINSKIVKTIPTVVATETTINMFNSMVNPVFKQILGLTKEIQTLENTRDTLLPKLLSGELDVSKLKIAEEN